MIAQTARACLYVDLFRLPAAEPFNNHFDSALIILADVDAVVNQRYYKRSLLSHNRGYPHAPAKPPSHQR